LALYNTILTYLAVFGDLLLLNTVKLTHNATMKPIAHKGYAATFDKKVM
jgi:hypothetical protein